MPAPSSWLTFLHLFEPCFTTPGMLLFEQLVTAWALCPGRRTLTRFWSVIPAERRRRHGAYARWVRKGKWSPDELWRCLVVQLVEHWALEGRLVPAARRHPGQQERPPGGWNVITNQLLII